MTVLFMEEWTNGFKTMSFEMNTMFNQVCASCRMYVGTNEASQETNEENADSKNSRRPANISQLMTEVGKELSCWYFFHAKKDEKRREKYKSHCTTEMNEGS